MFHKLKFIIASAPLLLIASACVEGSEPTGRPIITRGALEQDVYESTVILDPGTGTSQDEIDKLGPLFESFEKNAPRLFRQGDLGPRIEMIERAYMTSGRYMDLVAMYKRDVDKHGLRQGPTAIRLTWAMVRLGQEDEAKRLLGELLVLRPKNPDVWFLYGAYWIKYARSSSDAAKKVVLAWRKVVELDPQFSGFEGINAPTLKRETDAIAKGTRILPGELELLEATLTTRAKDTPKGDTAATDKPTPVVAEGEEATPGTDGETPPENAADEEVTAEVLPTETTPPTVANTENVEPVEETAPAEEAPVAKGPEPLTVLMGRAQMALSQGDQNGAAGFVKTAILTHSPEGAFDKLVDTKQSSRDIFTLIRLAWQTSQDRNGAARAFRKLAERVQGEKDATLTYEMAMFAWKELEDRPVAIGLFEHFARLDPARAGAMNIDKVIQSVRGN